MFGVEGFEGLGFLVFRVFWVRLCVCVCVCVFVCVGCVCVCVCLFFVSWALGLLVSMGFKVIDFLGFGVFRVRGFGAEGF